MANGGHPNREGISAGGMAEQSLFVWGRSRWFLVVYPSAIAVWVGQTVVLFRNSLPRSSRQNDSHPSQTGN